MALINCPECGKEISDTAKACPGCGRQIMSNNTISKFNKNAKCDENAYKIRVVINSILLFLGILFFCLIISSEGGIGNNSRMMGVAWLYVVAGGLGLIGRRKKTINRLSIFFYFLGVFYNLVMLTTLSAHIILFLISLIFVITIIINSNKDKILQDS